MLTKNSSTNHPANVLRSLLAKEHAITIFSKKTTKPLSAEVINLDLDTGQFDLSVNYHKSDIDTYIYQEHLSFDIEIASGAQEDKTEIYNFEKVKANLRNKMPTRGRALHSGVSRGGTNPLYPRHECACQYRGLLR